MSLTTSASTSPIALPAGVLTGIGSLPFSEPTNAVHFVARHCPQLPFCPQPPPGADLAASIVTQLRELSEIGGRQRRWFHAFDWAIRRGRFQEAVAFKTQVTGPLTLAQFGGLGPRSRIIETDIVHLTALVARWAAWQAARLLHYQRPTLVYVDEPVLGALRPNMVQEAITLINPVFAAIRSAGAIPGLHCCTGAPLQAMAASDADIVSMDITYLSPGITDGGSALNDPTRWLSLGLATSSGSPCDAFAHWLSSTSLVDDQVNFAKRTIITPTCGLGGVSPDAAEKTFRHAAQGAAAVARIAAEGESYDPDPSSYFT